MHSQGVHVHRVICTLPVYTQVYSHSHTYAQACAYSHWVVCLSDHPTENNGWSGVSGCLGPTRFLAVSPVSSEGNRVIAVVQVSQPLKWKCFSQEGFLPIKDNVKCDKYPYVSHCPHLAAPSWTVSVTSWQHLTSLCLHLQDFACFPIQKKKGKSSLTKWDSGCSKT